MSYPAVGDSVKHEPGLNRGRRALPVTRPHGHPERLTEALGPGAALSPSPGEVRPRALEVVEITGVTVGLHPGSH
jgi:hypothetical protein